MENSSDNLHDLSTRRLAQLVHQKSSLVIELHKVLSKQRSMIDDGDIDLMALLAIKQKLLEALKIVDRQMDPFRQQEPDDRIWAHPAERQECREESEACEALFVQVKQMEAYCIQKMQQLQAATQDQLQSTSSARMAANAYQQGYNSAAPQRNSLDITSEG